MNMIDMSKYGKVTGAIHYGETVEFWCESLDGGITDTRFMHLTFKDEATAAAIASLCNMKTPQYATDWTNNSSIELDLL